MKTLSEFVQETTKLEESSRIEGYFLANLIGFKAAKKVFASFSEANEYQKKFKHVPEIKSAKIVKGYQDPYGSVFET